MTASLVYIVYEVIYIYMKSPIVYITLKIAGTAEGYLFHLVA